MFNVGVIGYGVVGSATGDVFLDAGNKLFVYDKFKKIGSMATVASNSDIVFVCVPTPTVDGMQDLSPLMSALGSLAQEGCRVPVVIKCTVLPGTCDRLQTLFPELKLVHNPEFLTEKNAKADFINQKAIVLSGEFHTTQLVADVFRLAFRDTPVHIYADFKTTELGKYIHNCFLATKVAFMNEVFNFAEELGTPYDAALSVAKLQGVIGDSHTKVPGPDGHFGFGGMCFPKDTEALLSMPRAPAILEILAAAVRSNNKQRAK